MLRELASLLQALGDRPAALPLAERSRNILERNLGPEHPSVSEALDHLGRLHMSMEDYAGAKPLLDRALAIQEKASGADHPDVVPRLHALAQWFLDQEDYASARKLDERALAIFEGKGLTDDPELAHSLEILAETLRLLGDPGGTRDLLERAIAIREKAPGSQSLQLARALGHLAGLRVRTGDAAGALHDALRAEEIGRSHLTTTARMLEERRALGYASMRVSGLDVLLTLAARGLDPDPARQVWDALIRSRALVFDEMAARHRSIGESGDPEVAHLARELAMARTRLAHLVTSDAPAAGHRDRLERARGEKEAAERALAERSATFRRERDRTMAGMTEVASALPRDSALVAYARFDPIEAASEEAPVASSSDTASYLALVLRQGATDPVVVPLSSANVIDGLVRQWKEAAGLPPLGAFSEGQRAEDAYREVGERLRRAIWDPVAVPVEGAKQVFIVPDGMIHLVSMAALPEGKRAYLVETGPVIHYLSAERDLVSAQPSAPGGRDMLVIGGPAFEETSLFASLASEGPEAPPARPVAVATLAPFRGARSVCGDLPSTSFEPLPASEEEVREVAGLWQKKGGRAVALLGSQASEAEFKGKAPGNRVLHLATHAFFLGERCPSAFGPIRSVDAVAPAGLREPPPIPGENPLLLSGLALAGANHRSSAGPQEEDGMLTAEEIASLDLDGVEWAVLSACDTGAGEVKAGEGVLGLRRAFQVAGARTVILSLWSVEDASARAWMKALYEARLAGLSTAEAVRQASLTVLQHRRQMQRSTRPFYWAAFVADGDWR
jgi:CHAT domain-containing protein